jgi:glycosyltransferase involved in cell wall biosynthesis
MLKRKNMFITGMINAYNLDALFPNSNFPVRTRNSTKVISWYADLQHKYYPEFFSRRKRMERDLRIRFNLKNATDLVVSSQSVKNDFHKFYKVPDSLNISIYRFVSVLEDLPVYDLAEIRSKYKLPEQYFMISNQFHKHKNHKTAFLALAELKKKGNNIHFAVTGKFPEKPNSAYMQELHDIISEYDLNENISFLGLISRTDQVIIMKNAKAIIQPSLFEGWSTVIEDARSLQVPVIASRLDVNVEQLSDIGTYFEPHDFKALADILASFPRRDPDAMIYEPYDQRMKKAANAFLGLLSN